MRVPEYKNHQPAFEPLQSKRMVWFAGDKNPEKPADAPKATINIYDRTFDNQYLNGKEGKFDDKAEKTIDEIAGKIDGLDASQKEKVANELKQALFEQFPKAGFTSFTEFNKKLSELNVTKIKLEHIPQADLLVFRFFNAKNEQVEIPNRTIEIRYEPVAADIKSENEVTVTTKNRKKLLSELAPQPTEGDSLTINRYPLILKAQYRHGEWDVLGYKGNIENFLIVGDKVKYFRSTEIRTASAKVEIEGRQYQVLARYPKSDTLTFDALANVILNDSGKLNGQQIVPELVAVKIKATDISSRDYADLLKTAWESGGFGKEVLIVMPLISQKKRQAEIEAKETAQATEIKQRKAGETASRMGAAETNTISKIYAYPKSDDWQTIESAFTKANNGQESLSWALEKADNTFPNEGRERSVNPAISDLVENKSTWAEAWTNDKITGKQNVLLLKKDFADVLPMPEGQLMEGLRQAIAEGKNSNIYPADLMEKLGVKYPEPIEDYAQLQAASTIPDSAATLLPLRAKARRIVAVMETLSEEIHNFNIAGERATVAKEAKNKNIADNLQKLIVQLNVDSATPIAPTADPDEYYSKITINGVTASLHLENLPLGWNVYLLVPGTNTKIYKAHDGGSLDVADHVTKITSVMEGMRKGPGLIPGESFANLEHNKEVRNTKIFKYAKDFLTSIGSFQTAKMYSSEENTKELLENDSVVLNINYQGRPLTIKFWNNLTTTEIDIAPGYNNLQFPEANRVSVGGTYEGSKEQLTQKFKSVADRLEAAKETKADQQTVIRERLAGIFLSGSSAFDREGRRLTVHQMNAGETTAYTEDQYSRKYSGDAAYTIFFDRVVERNPDGTEKIELPKANAALTDLYQKGIQKVYELASRGGKEYKYYADIAKTLDSRPDLKKDHQINLEKPVSEFEAVIIRLGLIQDQENVEASQEAIYEKELQKVSDATYKLLVESGVPVDKANLDAKMKQFPVGILVSYQRMATEKGGEKKDILGLNVPILISLADDTTLAIVPGINTEGRLMLAVGVSQGAQISENWRWTGGISVGVGVIPGEKAVGGGVAASTGLEYRFKKAGPNENYDHFFGFTVSGAVGWNELLSVSAGPHYRWKIDAQKAYENGLKEHLKKEGLSPYIDQLQTINKLPKNQRGPKIEALAAILRSNSKLMDSKIIPKLASPLDAQDPYLLISAFKKVVADSIENFSENFDLPFIVGGQVKIDVFTGAAIVSGAITGNVPVILGGVASLGVQVLLSLEINVSSRSSIGRTQNTSEEKMDLMESVDRLQKFDAAVNKAFEGLEKSPQAAQLSTSGRNYLGADGHIRTRTLGETGPEAKQVTNLESWNQELAKIGIQLVRDAQGRLEIKFIPSENDGNVRIMLGPDIAVREGTTLYLKNPGAANFYFSKYDRYYPFEIGHGATKESVVMISNNRFLDKDSLPSQFIVKKYKGQGYEWDQMGPEGKADIYTERTEQFGKYSKAQKEMTQALWGEETFKTEEIRENLFDYIEPIYKFRDKSGKTFLDYTDLYGKKSRTEQVNYNKEELYKFFDEFASSQKPKLPPFNGKEKGRLLIELSVRRYVEIGSTEKDFQTRINWIRDNILTPSFQTRIAELKAKDISIDTSAKSLAARATEQISELSTQMEPNKLAEGLSAAIAIGRGARGFHHLLVARDSEVKPDGYILGHTDYAAILQDPNANSIDKDLARVLLMQMEGLPAIGEGKEYMQSPLARRVASLKILPMVIGLENYNKVIEFYQKGRDAQYQLNMLELKPFTELVEAIYHSEMEGTSSFIYTGADGKEYTVALAVTLRSAIFQKCANYSILFNGEITILPPDEDIGRILTARGLTVTTVDATVRKEFLSLFGGVVAAVDLTPAGGGGGGGGTKEKPVAGEQGKVEQPAAPEITQPSKPGAEQVTSGPSGSAP